MQKKNTLDYQFEELKKKLEKVQNESATLSEENWRLKDELKLVKMDFENLQIDYDRTVE